MSAANLEASSPTKDHAPAAAAAAATAAATVGAVAVAAEHAVEPSAASEASMGSQPSHLPDEAFCSGDAVPSQSPQPLLFKVHTTLHVPALPIPCHFLLGLTPAHCHLECQQGLHLALAGILKSQPSAFNRVRRPICVVSLDPSSCLFLPA